jgi:hypothetical protein
VVSAAFRYGLGLAFGLTALVVLGRRPWPFALLVALTFAARPLGFVLLVVILGGVAGSRSRHEIGKPALAIASVDGRAAWPPMPDGGRFPFSTAERLAALAFCGLGLA